MPLLKSTVAVYCGQGHFFKVCRSKISQIVLVKHIWRFVKSFDVFSFLSLEFEFFLGLPNYFAAFVAAFHVFRPISKGAFCKFPSSVLVGYEKGRPIALWVTHNVTSHILNPCNRTLFMKGIESLNQIPRVQLNFIQIQSAELISIFNSKSVDLWSKCQ
jgi:hypothetical protein